jgi:hypothetical protein
LKPLSYKFQNPHTAICKVGSRTLLQLLQLLTKNSVSNSQHQIQTIHLYIGSIQLPAKFQINMPENLFSESSNTMWRVSTSLTYIKPFTYWPMECKVSNQDKEFKRQKFVHCIYNQFSHWLMTLTPKHMICCINKHKIWLGRFLLIWDNSNFEFNAMKIWNQEIYQFHWFVNLTSDTQENDF